MSTTNQPLRVLSFNCFLTNHLFRRPLIANDPLERAGRIGAFAREFDLCLFQEVWGPGFSELVAPLTGTHSISPLPKPSQLPYPFQPSSLSSSFSSLISSIKFWLRKTGGLSTAITTSTPVLWTHRHTFQTSDTMSRKGISCALIDVTSIWSEKRLLLFNTHLDAFNDTNKKIQINEVVSFIDYCINHLEGVTKMEVTAVILCGDFNVNSTSELYKTLVSPRPGVEMLDYFKKAVGSEIHTYDSENGMVENLEGVGRIDYILGLESLTRGNGETVKFLPLKCVEFMVHKTGKGQEMSDHWAISGTFLPADKIN